MFFIRYRNRPGFPATDILELLAAARKRGVEIKILLETSSARNITRSNQWAAAYLAKNDITVRFHPVYPIMHTKLVVIDGKTTILGSHNWTMGAMEANVESSVLIRSEQASEKYLSYFQKLFYRATPYRED